MKKHDLLAYAAGVVLSLPIIAGFVLVNEGCTAAQKKEAQTAIDHAEPVLGEIARRCIDAEVLFGNVDPVKIRLACALLGLADEAILAEVNAQKAAVDLMVSNHAGAHPALCP